MGLVSCAWFLWTELKLKLAIGKMDSEGLWKHALRPLLLSVMFLLWCLLCWSLLCYTASSVLCPLLLYFGPCCLCYILGFVCSILFTLSITSLVIMLKKKNQPFTILYTHVYFHLRSNTLTRFPFSACPVGG